MNENETPKSRYAHEAAHAKEMRRVRAARRAPRTIKRDCPECFLDYGHESWCKKSE